MATKDHRQIDQLVTTADMAVRIASQIRLWMKRKRIDDAKVLERGIEFLSEALRGGEVINTGNMVSGFTSLYPLNWSADAQVEGTSIKYDELLALLNQFKEVLVRLEGGENPEQHLVEPTAGFFDQLGRLLGNKADSALRSPPASLQMMHERVSHR